MTDNENRSYDISVYSDQSPQALTSINLVCPKCEVQNLYQITGPQLSYSFQCPSCSKTFVSQICKIRSKNSRGSRKDGRRQFSVRVYDLFGSEQLIEFVNSGYDDFELRSRDGAVFSYLDNRLTVVQNLTVARYMKISNPWCYLATYVYGPLSVEVAMLRYFRDDVLVSHKVLSAIVEFYYYSSPILIKYFGTNKLFRLCCMVVLEPFVRLSVWRRKK